VADAVREERRADAARQHRVRVCVGLEDTERAVAQQLGRVQVQAQLDRAEGFLRRASDVRRASGATHGLHLEDELVNRA